MSDEIQYEADHGWHNRKCRLPNPDWVGSTKGMNDIFDAVDGIDRDARKQKEEDSKCFKFADRLADAIVALTKPQRRYIILKFYQQKQDVDIARMLGVTKQSVEDVKKAALKNLLKFFQDLR